MMFKDLLMALDVFWAGTLIIARHSKFCILINYPEICNAYGSLVHLQATKHHLFIWADVCLCLDSISSISNSLFIFVLLYPPLCLIHNDICIWSVLLSLHAFSLCLSLSGKPYKMCRLKLMYNRWSSRLQVTDGGSYGFQNVILLIHREGWI